MKAIWNGRVVAEDPQAIEFDGGYYFPLAALDPGCLRLSGTTTTCPRRGRVAHFTLKAGARISVDAVLHVEDPPGAARQLANRVTFGADVDIVR